MAKVKYDVSKAEVRNFEVPKPGVYEAHIHEMSHGDSSSGNPMFTIVFEITKGENKGARVWYYILTDGSQEWRLREFTDALGLKTKGELDTDKLKGTVLQIKTAIDPARDGYDEKARIKNVLPAAGTSKGESSEEDDEAPYEEWSLSDLKEEVEARELTIKGRATKQKLVDALEEDDENENQKGDDSEEEEEGDEEEGDEDSITRAELDKMSRAELKKLIAEEELDIKVLKKHSEDDLREKIADALELEEEEPEEEEEEEGDDDSDEDNNYEEWEISELKSELKERGLKTDGRKSALVKRLKDDDKSDEEPF